VDENYIIDNAAGLLAMMKNWRPPKKLDEIKAANAKALTDMGKMTEGIYKTDRELVTEWMESNGFDDEDKTYILNDCKNTEARKYWVKRANGEIKC